MTSIDVMSSDAPPEPPKWRKSFMGTPFDCLDTSAVLALVAETKPGDLFRYVVTPNVDHVVRLNQNGSILKHYESAWLSLCDSRPLAALAALSSVKLDLVTGSDLTANLFQSVVRDGDPVTLIAANTKVVRDIRYVYPDVVFSAFVAPPGVAGNPQALKTCVDFAVGQKARFVFICIGSPQSEEIAYALSQHPDASGTAFCVGASLEFLTGDQKRAPLWMRQAGLEWLHRLASNPKRLWRRYAYSILPLLRLFSNELFASHRPRKQ